MRAYVRLALLVGMVAVVLGLTPPSHGQTLLLTLDMPNPQVGAEFGWSLDIGDVNGDGKADIVVGVPYENVGANYDQGRTYVFSGVNGALLRALDTPNPEASSHFGRSLATGDVNGDGKADIAVGADWEDAGGNYEQGRAYVFSGANGSLLFTLNTPNPQVGAYFGRSLAMGDVNGDGRADIAVGAFDLVGSNDDQGRVYVFSGSDGSRLFTLDTPDPRVQARFGWALAMNDVNGDSRADIAVTAPGWAVEQSTDDQGRAYVFSGANASLLLTLDTPNPQAYAHFGHSLAMGDVNGDGKADIAVGADEENVTGITHQGRAYVLSGADGSLIFTLNTPNPQASAYFSKKLAVRDVNGDGRADIAVGAPYENVAGNIDQGRAYVFSGSDGSLSFTLDTPNPQADAYLGYSVAAGDLDGNGKADIAVGATREDVGGNDKQGRVYVFSAPVASCYTLDLGVSGRLMTGPDGVIDYDPNSSGACSERSYAPGTVVELTAHAAQGRQWSQSSYWSGTDNNSANPTNVTMNGERSVTAHFTENQSDTDGFSDPVETYLGTDPLDACPDDTNDDAWPLDVNRDGQISVVGDVLNFRDRIGATPGAPNWRQRLDFNADGQISVVGDVLMYRDRIGETCT